MGASERRHSENQYLSEVIIIGEKPYNGAFYLLGNEARWPDAFCWPKNNVASG